ncbi:hypothetical protein ACJQWK_03031 [Exserohilum turcicum]|uniref:Hydrophobin n=1 Tax=Exserohilum turcicum (strain 28A) TaxID=671987 RepID=R0KSA0_EXST2|nr:uncharacterized protein SETTUDRAFT_18525 [Exserohilum turcica Et28A]EOA91864.1 hypothetical protein SETTUDRAFT_18525 [Exserohilum turcica Et28A]
MRFTIFALIALIGFTSGAAVTKRHDTYYAGDESYQGGEGNDGGNGGEGDVCGPLSTPLCCQTDILGVANLNCENAGPVSDVDAFNAVCAETGLTAQCCILPLGADGLICTAA